MEKISKLDTKDIVIMVLVIIIIFLLVGRNGNKSPSGNDAIPQQDNTTEQEEPTADVDIVPPEDYSKVYPYIGMDTKYIDDTILGKHEYESSGTIDGELVKGYTFLLGRDKNKNALSLKVYKYYYESTIICMEYRINKHPSIPTEQYWFTKYVDKKKYKNYKEMYKNNPDAFDSEKAAEIYWSIQ